MHFETEFIRELSSRARCLWTGFVILIILLLAPNQVAAGMDSFSVGETARYQVRWSFVVAGHVDISVRQDTLINDQPARHFSMTAETLPFIDIFYKVRDNLDAFTDTEVTRSLGYRKVQTGSSKRDIKLQFDWQQQQAVYRNFAKSLAPIAIPAGTFDPLSAYFFLRTQDFTSGDEIFRPVTDGKKVVVGKAKILSRQRIKVPAGEFDTYLVEPDMREVRGVFAKEKNARLLLWLTVDDRHLLIKAKSRVRVGSFIAELENISNASDPKEAAL